MSFSLFSKNKQQEVVDRLIKPQIEQTPQEIEKQNALELISHRKSVLARLNPPVPVVTTIINQKGRVGFLK